MLLLAGSICICLSACDKDDDSANSEEIVTFAVKSQAFDEDEDYTWPTDSEVGVFMLNPGGALPYDAIEDGKNRKYKVDGASALVPATNDEAIRWPQMGVADFVAYTPWKPIQNGGINEANCTYPIDVNGQDAPGFNINTLDLMYAKTNGKMKGQTVPLTFNHALAKISISIYIKEIGDDFTEESIANMSAKLIGVPSTADLNLANGTLSNLGGYRVALSKIGTAENKALFEGIYIPHSEKYYPAQATIWFGNGEVTYFTLDQDFSINAGECMTIGIATYGPEISYVETNIVPWTGTDEEPSTGNANDANPAKLEMVKVKAGTFTMGDADNYSAYYNEGNTYDITPHEVTLTHDFYMSKYEVTNAQYCQFLNNYPHAVQGTGAGAYAQANAGTSVTCFKETVDLSGKKLITGSDKTITYNGSKWVPVAGYESHPVTAVNWHGAVAFCHWVGGRLPSEAEWEYASRAGGTGSNSMGTGDEEVTADNLEDYEWFLDNAGATAHGIGKKLPNAWNLYDMNGNVAEWCYDWYNENFYTTSAAVDPVNITPGAKRVARGGYLKKESEFCRPAYRFNCDIDVAPAELGFRVVFPTN